MTRQLEDLRAVWCADENDICSPDELLARVARRAPRARRAALAVVAAVVVVAGVVATVVALRSSHHSVPQAGVGPSVTTSTVLGTPSASPTVRPSPTASGTSVVDRTRQMDVGVARVTVPVRWFAVPYRGRPAGSTTYLLGTDRFTGPCAQDTGQLASCSSATGFFPGTRTPRAGLLVVWGRSHGTGTDALRSAPGVRTTIHGRPARLYSGDPTASCPAGTMTQIEAHIATPQTQDVHALVDVVACLGPHVSSADRRAVYTMILSA